MLYSAYFLLFDVKTCSEPKNTQAFYRRVIKHVHYKDYDGNIDLNPNKDNFVRARFHLTPQR